MARAARHSVWRQAFLNPARTKSRICLRNVRTKRSRKKVEEETVTVHSEPSPLPSDPVGAGGGLSGNPPQQDPCPNGDCGPGSGGAPGGPPVPLKTRD